MKKACINCQHFKSKGTMLGDHVWGLCSRFGYSRTMGKCKNNDIFRWGDDTCQEFALNTKPVKKKEHVESLSK